MFRLFYLEYKKIKLYKFHSKESGGGLCIELIHFFLFKVYKIEIYFYKVKFKSYLYKNIHNLSLIL